MPSFIEEFIGSYGKDVSKQLSSNLGIDPKAATKLIPQVAPLILGGLKKQMSDHGGEDRVDHILNKYGNAGVLDDIAGLVASKAKDRRPDPRLGGLLGQAGVDGTEMLSREFRIDPGVAKKIIPMLAPLLLGALSRKRDAGGAGKSGIASLIDQDGDGNILDDVGGFFMKQLGGGSRKGGGILGSVIGGLLRKSR